ncbi:MAG: phosphatidylglycerophosphatase A [Bryobacteraceae bacterium]|nr:phosphatidylglycerophosphatase A [Bryobacteraceae bacterium]
MKPFATLIATAGGAGYWPWGPGTAGSLVGVGIAWLLARQFEFTTGWPMLPLTILATWPGVWASTVAAGERKDPQFIVVDEVLGVWLTLAGATVWSWQACALGFVLFRIFDIVKPWPVRRFEALPRGWGIVADDLMAGVYGAILLFWAGWFHLYS